MSYLNCPNCRLTVVMTWLDDPVEHCPRCLARQQRKVDLFVSAKVGGREPLATRGGPWLIQGPRPERAAERSG